MTQTDPVTIDERRPTVNPETLSVALNDANIPTLVGVLAHLTGDDKWLAEPYRPRRAKGPDDNDDGGLSPDTQDEIRAAISHLVAEPDAGNLAPKEVSPSRVTQILSAVLGEEVPEEYGGVLCEELGVQSRTVTLTDPGIDSDFSVGVIGAGMSGIAAGISLQESGITFDILEKNSAVGGTWLENTYPGCGVDTPSSLYSYSFAPNDNWSQYFAQRDEVESYFQQIADDHGINRYIRFGCEVVSATYNNARPGWTVVVQDSKGQRHERTYSALISAVGQVNRASIPAIEGSETFRGATVHTAAWDASVDVTGKSVAVIGTGASAMQLVPAIAGQAGRITIFQRSKQWALPHPNYTRYVKDGVKVLNKAVPFYARWYRLRAFWNFGDRLHKSLQIDPSWPHGDRSINAANERHREFLTNYIKEQLGERADLLEKTVPAYPPYLKRPLIDNGWYQTIKRDDVELVTSNIERITPDAVVDKNGNEYPTDILVFATGFKILQFLAPMEIVGRSGVSIRQTWGPDDARAYLGVTVPDFPNLFILNGPNTFAGHGGSAILATEFQLRYILQCIERLASGKAKAIEVRKEAFESYNAELDAALDKMIWSHRGATNYFRNDAGRIVVNSPWKYVDYWRRTLKYDPDDYWERS